MKRHSLITLFACLLICCPSFAQDKQRCSEDEFRMKKQAYITEKAGLTSEEAQAFFPIYFELQEKKKEKNKKTWSNARKGMKPETSEEEYQEIINQHFNSQHEILDLEKEYIDKYRKVLTDKKIYMVYRAEIKFNRNMLKILQKMDEKK